ncbi:MAG: SpoIIE family protein phosphatase [Phycisphaerae bacterium]|nr:SpoIIE family protein phosphatase [Phycisphaerae bacterium]
MPDDVSTTDASPPRILLVDDEPGVRGLLRNVLKGRYECECIEAHDGIQAQEILRAEDIDVVIVDLTMPRMDGMSLLRWAKEERNSSAWIILSGAGGFDDALEAIHLGAFDYIAKPIHNVDELVITVRNAVRQRHLEMDRERLMEDVEERNLQLAEQVVHLQEACRILTNQQETIDADLRRAELIQRALLPLTVPDASRTAVNTIYRPSHIVGGDLYDLIPLPSGHLAVYVADAAGHGLSAAMLAVLFKHRVALWDDRIEQPIPPEQVLQAVNNCLWEECKAPGLFVTAIYALVEPDGEHVTLASAGHPPAVLCRSDGSFEILTADSPALGINEQVRYFQNVVSLEDGDRLLLYTDGLFTSPDPQEALTPEIVANLIVSHPDDSRTTLNRLLAAAVDRRRGYGQEDDITMVMLALGEATSGVDNGLSEAEPPEPPPASAPGLQIGQNEQGTVICLNGRGCWTHSADFYEVCLQELTPDRTLTVDLSYCEYLDSTFLGTLQELADQSDQENMPFYLQHVPDLVMDLLRELGMTRVVGRIRRGDGSIPKDLMPVLYGNFSDRDHQHRVLHAHEALAELNEDNRREFDRLIDMLRRELEPHTVHTGE